MRAALQGLSLTLALGYAVAAFASAGLTPQQVEAARMAWSMGYFDVPRGCALSDIAKAAGVSNATISGHLREVDRIAHRRLLDWIGE